MRKLYGDLSDKTREALDKYLDSLQSRPDDAPGQLAELKGKVRAAGGLTVIVLGTEGEQIVSTSADALADEQRLPDTIRGITFDSSMALRTYNISLMNRFRLALDFAEPPGILTYNPFGQPTPNDSVLEVTGPDTTWATAVYESTLKFFKARQKQRGWLHTLTTFNVFDWFISFPGALWIVYRLASHFESSFQTMHGALRGAIYVYIMFMALLAFRVMVAVARWIFPLVELEGARSKSARNVLGTLLIALFSALLYDILKTLFLT